jgi:tRNA (guanine-N7-)-methyltransferase
MSLTPHASAGPVRIWTHDLSFPTDPAKIFGRPGPLVMEIGFGNGAFLCDLAQREPDWNLLGVEIAAASISRGVLRARREGLDNVRLYCGNGRFLLWDVLPEASVRHIIVNFPDPWPKERHLDRRLLNAEFFELATRRLQDGGDVWLTTDHPDYFEFACQQARSTGLIDVIQGPAPPETLQTKYAEKWQSMDLRIHHARFVPHAQSERSFAPRVQEADVAHARLRGDLSEVTRFEKRSLEIEGGHIVLVEASRTLDGNRLHFEVIVEEGDLRQSVLVEARPSQSGVYVGLEHFGAPAQTRGVKRAVLAVADWLEEQGLAAVEKSG